MNTIGRNVESTNLRCNNLTCKTINGSVPSSGGDSLTLDDVLQNGNQSLTLGIKVMDSTFFGSVFCEEVQTGVNGTSGKITGKDLIVTNKMECIQFGPSTCTILSEDDMASFIITSGETIAGDPSTQKNSRITLNNLPTEASSSFTLATDDVFVVTTTIDGTERKLLCIKSKHLNSKTIIIINFSYII